MSAGLRWGSTLIQNLLCVFNLVFMLCGILIITLCAIALRSEAVAVQDYNAALIVMIVVGVIAFLVSFVGCYGAMQKKRILLIGFAGFLTILIITELVAVGLAFANSDRYSVHKTIQDVFQKAQQNFQDYIEATDAVQSNFECCGLNGPSFWNGRPLPQSCCPSYYTTPCSYETAFPKGCQSAVSEFIEKYGKIAGAIGIVIVLIEIIGASFAFYLAGAIKSLTSS